MNPCISKMEVLFKYCWMERDLLIAYLVCSIWSMVQQMKEILAEVKLEKSQIIRDNFLKNIKDTYTDFEFLQLLVARCSFNIFSFDHVSCIFVHLLDDNFGQANSKNACVTLLMIIVNAFPLLLKGSEEQFCTLLLQKIAPFCNELLQMLVKAGPHISFDLRKGEKNMIV